MKGEVCKGTATEQESFLKQSISAEARVNRGDRDGNEPAAPPVPPERLRPRQVPAPRLRAPPPLPGARLPEAAAAASSPCGAAPPRFFHLLAHVSI